MLAEQEKRNGQKSNKAGMGATCITQRKKRNQRAKKSSYGQRKQEQQRTGHKKSAIFSLCNLTKVNQLNFPVVVSVGYAVTSFTMLIKLHARVVAFKNGLSVFFLSFFFCLAKAFTVI